MRGAAAPTGTFTESRPDRPTSAPLSLKLGEGRLRCSDAAQTRGAESTRLQQPTRYARSRRKASLQLAASE